MPQFNEKTGVNEIRADIEVPTNDDDVRACLRSLNEPAQLPKEDRYERRQRLLNLVALRGTNGLTSISDSTAPQDVEKDVFVEGSANLRAMRAALCDYALPILSKLEVAESDLFKAYKQNPTKKLNYLITKSRQQCANSKSSILIGTQIWETRPVCTIRCSTKDYIFAGNYSGGLAKLDWDLTVHSNTKAHISPTRGISVDAGLERVYSGGSNGVAIHDFDLNLVSKLNTATSSPENTSQPKPTASQSITCLDLHPDGKFLVAGSTEGKFRVWDLPASECALEQNLPNDVQINALKLHESGALLLGGCNDSVVRLFDLRQAKPCTEILTHCDVVTACAWRPNSFQFVTGGRDNKCCVSDMRMLNGEDLVLNTVYAHTDSVTEIVYTADCMATASLDGTVKLWSLDTYRLLQTFKSPAKVLCLDAGAQGMVSGRWDHSIDLYMQ